MAIQDNQLFDQAMRLAIDEGKKSVHEKDKTAPTPKVGAVIVNDNGQILGSAFRGQYAEGDHAEYTLLQKVLKGQNVSGTTLFATLEPCTYRKTPDFKSCCEWIIGRGIKHVRIGMLDPNPSIYGKGCRTLRAAGITLDFFPADLRSEIETDNREFIAQYSANTDFSGTVSFDYTNNDGHYTLGNSECRFTTTWTTAGVGSIYAYNDHETIDTIAIADDGSTKINEITDATVYVANARSRLINTGEILVIKNTNGFWAAIKILEVHCKNHATGHHELKFEFKILPDRSSNFSKETAVFDPFDYTTNENIILVDEINGKIGGNSAYFGFTDYYVMDLLRRINLESPQELYDRIESRLKIACLFFDRIIIHSVDIMRDQKICSIIKNYSPFIKDKKILFFYSSKISAVDQSQIRAYIQKRKRQGEEGLDNILDDAEYFSQVMEILKSSPYIVVRKHDEDKSHDRQDHNFIKRVQFDLPHDSTKKPITAGEYGKATLYDIFDGKKFLDALRSAIQIESVHSRKQIIDFAKKVKGKGKVEWLKHIEARLCILFARMNSSSNFMIDFDFLSNKKSESAFSVRFFQDYFASLLGLSSFNINNDLSIDLLELLKKHDRLQVLIADYMQSYVQWKSSKDTGVSTGEIFHVNSQDRKNGLEDIKKLFPEHS